MKDWIDVLVTDSQDRLVSRTRFATEAERPVAFASEPLSGDLFYVAIASGEVRRIRSTETPAGTPLEPLTLSAPRPNPSRGAIALALQLVNEALVTFAVYDITGREVWRSPDREASAGQTELVWSGVTRKGTNAPTGIYLARVTAAGQEWTRRVVILRE
jgi:hypothetical protein